MAIYRVNAGDEETEWSLSNQLLATIVDRLNFDAYAAAGGKGPKPKQIPRPGVGNKTTKVYKSENKTTVTEIEAWLAKRRGA